MEKIEFLNDVHTEMACDGDAISRQLKNESVFSSALSDSLQYHCSSAQAPLPMKFPRQEHYGSGCHFHLEGIFLTQGSTQVPHTAAVSFFTI